MDEARTGDERSPDDVDALLAGLADQAAALEAVYDDAAAEDLARAARAEIPLLDRLRAAASVTIEVIDHGTVAGMVLDVGRDVVVVNATDGTWAIHRTGIAAVIGASDAAAGPGGAAARLGLASIARAWARERGVVRVIRRGAVPLDGTIDRVGADHLDLAEHDPGTPRLGAQVRRSVAVPFDVISAQRLRP